MHKRTTRPRRLVVARETVRRLGDAELARPRGGFFDSDCFTLCRGSVCAWLRTITR